jgi:hypothetical protein
MTQKRFESIATLFLGASDLRRVSIAEKDENVKGVIEKSTPIMACFYLLIFKIRKGVWKQV